PPLQNLHHRLLDKSIQHRRDAQLAHPSVRFGDFHPPHRLRLVGSVQQLFPDGWPVLPQIIRERHDRHAVDARTTLVGLHLPQRLLQVFSLTYLLHQSVGSSWAFGSTCRPQRFSLFSCDTSGCTRQRRREVQFHLDILLLVVFETHGLLTAPSRSGLLRRRILCPMLTSAPRSGRLSTASVAHRDTEQISWGKLSCLPCAIAESTLRTLMDTDFAVSCPLVRCWRLLSGFCPSTRTFDPCFFQTPPRGGSPCIITRPSPPSGWPEDFHLQTAEHAQHTTKARDRATPATDRAETSRPAWRLPASSKRSLRAQ